MKRHPLEVTARFRHSLVLTYALPAPALEPLLPPGLELDTFHGFGFLAVALVQTEALRPAFCPEFLGQDFFLAGYRVFARCRSVSGRVLRGLRILRSDTDRRLMVIAGNGLTHYNYHLAKARVGRRGDELEIQIETPRAEADLHVVADLTSPPAGLPAGSPFGDFHEARLFAGPLPFTFDYERKTQSVVLIEGVRQNWKPRPVGVRVLKNTFLRHAPFEKAEPILANAFYIENIPYRWKPGRLEGPLHSWRRHWGHEPCRASHLASQGVAAELEPWLGGSLALPDRGSSKGLKGAGNWLGMWRIVRFNWHWYVAALAVTLLVIAGWPLLGHFRWLRAAAVAGLGLAWFWSVISLLVSHWIYDVSPLCLWHWLPDQVTLRSGKAVNIHAGFDQTTPELRRLFPGVEVANWDIYCPALMSEASIRRARHGACGDPKSKAVDFRNLPAAKDTLDAAFLMFAAHELRAAGAREAFFRELCRIIKPGGTILIVEHLRDWRNFLAYGPGFLHFFSRREWLRLAKGASLRLAAECPMTPWVRIFRFTKCTTPV